MIPFAFYQQTPAPASITLGRNNSNSVSGVGGSFTIGWSSGGAATNGTWLVAAIRVSAGTGAISGGSTWTQIGSTGIWYKQCGASEPTTYSIVYSGSGKGDDGVVAICEVIGANSMESSASATSTNTAPSVTSTNAADCVVLGMGNNAAAATITPPTGWTKQIGNNNGSRAVAIAAKLNAGSGTIAPGTWNASYSSLVSLAFKP